MLVATDSTFGERLRSLREAAGLNQSQLAERAEFTRQYISLLEKGRARATWETVVRLARAIGVPVGAFDIEEYPIPPQPAVEPPPPPPRQMGKRK